ncbi:hypothetical protein HPP92_022131 [Vanilla planifolia]|uniref:Uncharacterized protein n=1 Tax=Vanilla planifolia TaxID=51239 RepID=A0A835PSQ4_VANPL|nr:hypothetical protein HPP92_022131 [Vanilla planifolia]
MESCGSQGSAIRVESAEWRGAGAESQFARRSALVAAGLGHGWQNYSVECGSGDWSAGRQVGAGSEPGAGLRARSAGSSVEPGSHAAARSGGRRGRRRP